MYAPERYGRTAFGALEVTGEVRRLPPHPARAFARRYLLSQAREGGALLLPALAGRRLAAAGAPHEGRSGVRSRGVRRRLIARRASSLSPPLAANLAWTRYAASLGPLDLAASREGSTLVVDRDGRLLRAFTLPDGRWRLPATTHDVDPRYLAMLIAYEDGRFYEHHGVDPRALLRAAGQWLMRGHIVSGGSTLTMQVARLIEPRPERTLAAKLRQIARARDDRARGRQGGRARPLCHAGAVRRQSRRRARRLARLFRQGAAEAHDRRGGAAGRAAAVARGAPAGPLRPPPRAPPATACSTGFAARGVISADEAARGQSASRSPRRAKPSPSSPRTRPRRRSRPTRQAKVIRLSIDARLQAKLETLAKESVARLGPKLSAAIVVDRQRERRDPRPRRRGRSRRRLARRRDRHVARAALAGLGAEALHLRARLRGGPRPSRDGAVRPADALRRLRAGEFRSRLSGHGDGAQGAADVAEPAGDRASGRRRAGDLPRPAARRGRRDRAAEGDADRARHRPRGPRRFADRHRPPLRGLCARRRGAGADRAARRRARRSSGRAASPIRSRPGMSPTSCAARRRRRIRSRAGSPSRPARPTAFATRWRSASTAGRRSRSGSGGPTTARRRA